HQKKIHDSVSIQLQTLIYHSSYCEKRRTLFQKVEETPKVVQANSKPGTWSCPICTFANDEELSACDICGVFWDPVVSNNGDNKKS
ncbi:hypothetical protein MKX01_028473, partial [Papaver californicum]